MVLFVIKTEENRVKAKEAKLREDHQAASTKEFEIRQQMSKYTNEIEGKRRTLLRFIYMIIFFIFYRFLRLYEANKCNEKRSGRKIEQTT